MMVKMIVTARVPTIGGIHLTKEFTTCRGVRLGGPGLAANKSVWGIPVVTSSAVPAGKFIFGNFTQTVTIYDRQQVAVEMTGTNEDDFTHYLYTIRASRRLALAVEVPAGIFAGDFRVTPGK